MRDPVMNKASDFAGYGEVACRRYAEGSGKEALMNLRNCGEAACKVILLSRLSEKRALAAIDRGVYQWMVEAIVREQAAPSDIVNCLKTLQIHGNIGNHDTPVHSADVEMGMVAFRKLAGWLYKDLLNATPPQALSRAIASTDAGTRHAAELLEREHALDSERRLKEEKIAELAAIRDQERQKAERSEQLRTDIEQANERITEWGRETERLRTELAEEMRVARTQPAPQALPVATVPRRTRTKLIWMAGSVALVAGSIWWFASQGEEAKRQVAMNPFAAPTGDTMRVVIMPLQVLQDDPNASMGFEEAIATRMRLWAASQHLPVQIVMDTLKSSALLTRDAAIAHLQRRHANLLLFGALYDPTASDSGRVELAYCMQWIKNHDVREVGPMAFRTMADSSARRAIDAAVFLMHQALANHHGRQRRFREALSVLYRAQAVTIGQKHLLASFNAHLHERLKEFGFALREARTAHAFKPDEPWSQALLAHALLLNGRSGEAMPLLEKSLGAQPDQPQALVDLASYSAYDRPGFTHRPEEALRLCEHAVALDSSVYEGWLMLGDLYQMDKKHQAAAAAYLRCVELEPEEREARLPLARILAFDLKDPSAAETVLAPVLAKDSTDAEALFLLADIYSNTALRKPAVADRLYTMSRLNDGRAEAGSLFQQGRLDMQQGRLPQAYLKYHEAWSKDSSIALFGNELATLCMALGRYDEGLRVAERCAALDTTSFMTQYNAGLYFYFPKSPQRDARRAANYLYRAVNINPNDTTSLELLGSALNEIGDNQNAVRVLRRAESMDPYRSGVHRALGLALDALGNTIDAEQYYRRSLKRHANDWRINMHLAHLIVRTRPADAGSMLEALDLSNRAVVAVPQSPDANSVFTSCLYNSGQFKLAAQYYRKTMALDPTYRDVVLEQELARNGAWP